MAITGKEYTALLDVAHSGAYPVINTHRTLYYYDNGFTLDDIAEYYPSLTWDEAIEIGKATLLSFAFSTAGDDYEANQLAAETFYAANTSAFGSSIYVWYLGGVWQTGGGFNGNGSPSHVAAQFPDANNFAITSATPFGSYGNGLIRAQALYHWDIAAGGGPNGTTLPIAGVYSDANPGTDGRLIISAIDHTYIWTPSRDDSDTPPDGGGDGTGEPGGGDTPPTSSDVMLRCWAFSLDGHDFYVLRLGTSSTLVYDLTTGMWSQFQSTGGRQTWRAHCGQNWVGMAADTFANAFGSDIVAGDDATGVLWILDPATGRDDRSDDSGLADFFTRQVTGGIQMTGRDTVPCNAITIDLALGNPTQSGASFTLEISDDLAQTWTDCGSIIVADGDFSSVVEWRSLGIIGAPGRVFRLTDDGASIRVGGMNMR